MVIKGANGLEVRATDGGLRPPLPSSVAPSGIPARPTDDTEPDEADAVGPAKELLPIEAQVPDAVPAMPPPSNSDVGVAVPAVDVPVPYVAPKDVCGIEPPMPEHVVVLPVVAPIGDAPDVVGLTPGDASCVAPKGTRVGATGEPGPMPSGELMPRGEASGEMLIPPTCAKAEPQPNRTAAVVAIIKRVIVGSISFCIGFVVRGPEALPDGDLIARPDITLRGLPRFARYCVDRSMPRSSPESMPSFIPRGRCCPSFRRSATRRLGKTVARYSEQTSVVARGGG
jgi:hypothetical protein